MSYGETWGECGGSPSPGRRDYAFKRRGRARVTRVNRKLRGVLSASTPAQTVRGYAGDVAVDRAFWHERTVFVTGHTGFKGAWLTLWLRSLGARVTGFSL